MSNSDNSLELGGASVDSEKIFFEKTNLENNSPKRELRLYISLSAAPPLTTHKFQIRKFSLPRLTV